MIRWLTAVVLLTHNLAAQEPASPCPRSFRYEPRNPSEPDRIYGILTLHTDQDLNGVWLRLIFDRPSLQLGNWFGIVKTDDNVVYRIQNPQRKLDKNVPVHIRFYVKYNVDEPAPRLVEWRLNAKTVCPESAVSRVTESTNMYFTSPELTTLSTPMRGQNFGMEQLFHSSQGNSNEDDDFFMGDFALLGKPKPKPILEEVQCGVVIKPAQPLITYGQPTKEGEFPWHVALYHARGIDLTYICGGSLVTLRHVITVAHCVTRRKSQSALSPSTLMVYLGKYYLKVWSNQGIQDRQIEKIIVHQRYNSHTFSNDIAVLKLYKPADLTDFVRPVCLWQEQASLEAVISRQGTVVGWGFDETGKVTEQLTQAHMPIVSQETCIYSFPEFYSRFTSDHTYCAGFNNGTSVCNGDSGGGMVFPMRGSSSYNPIWQLRGMVSISVALQNQFKCDASHYVVFTDVAKYTEWIKNALEV